MISMEGTNLGVTVKKLRETRGMSRIELSEAVGISESHLKKIEAGNRQPGIQTYRKMIVVLEADIVIRDMTGTVMGDCTARRRRFLWKVRRRRQYFWCRFWSIWHRP